MPSVLVLTIVETRSAMAGITCGFRWPLPQCLELTLGEPRFGAFESGLGQCPADPESSQIVASFSSTRRAEESRSRTRKNSIAPKLDTIGTYPLRRGLRKKKPSPLTEIDPKKGAGPD